MSNNGEVSELAMAFALVYIVFAGLFCVSILWLVAVGWWRTWRNRPSKRRTRREPARLCAIGEEVFVGGRWLCVARRSVDHVELVDLDTGSTIAWPADQPIERQVRRP